MFFSIWAQAPTYDWVGTVEMLFFLKMYLLCKLYIYFNISVCYNYDNRIRFMKNIIIHFSEYFLVNLEQFSPRTLHRP